MKTYQKKAKKKVSTQHLTAYSSITQSSEHETLIHSRRNQICAAWVEVRVLGFYGT
jgi:hypothetical protein